MTDARDDIAQGGEDDALAAEYALGLLSRAEAEAFEARMVQEPDLRAAYARWAEDFAALTDDIAPVAPPAHLRARIEAQVLGAPPARRRFGLFGWLAGAGAALALAAVVVLMLGPIDRISPDAPPPLVAEVAAEDGSLILAAGFDPDTGELALSRDTGQAVPGRVLELWLIAGDAAPVSLGVLPDDSATRITVPEALRPVLAPGAVLAVSDEPPGGSPTGQPTGDVLAVGQITAS
ncbi:anti-sigma factor [Lacimonas salitolerans]|uniref:Regulator of SigK n=1 Tax=Lacimonas salitolerans TaxID=1323750 RepID=A0ABW4EHE6_9RHOB